jgi:hypothetical protein
MREKLWQLMLFILSISAMIGGIAFYIKKWNPNMFHWGGVSLVKAPQGNSESDNPLKREVSSEHAEDDDSPSKGDDDDVPGSQSISEKMGMPLKKIRSEANLGADEYFCRSIEFQGDGFQGTKITVEEWKRMIDVFHESKQHLHRWLEGRQKLLSEKTGTFLKGQLENTKLMRPPAIDEPDLNWRGIGVWSRDDQGYPMIRLSSGFLRLLTLHPKRAQFEMTRLIAQGWAPCEIQRAGLDSPWESSLKCLEAFETPACSAGAFSEGGWAISSALAAAVSPPGCELQALSDPKKRECLPK